MADQQPQLSGKVLLYQNPEPLSYEQHSSLGLKTPKRPFDFLSGSHIVPLTINEFAMAASNFPIIFAGEEKVALAVMGIKPGENLFVQEDGSYQLDAYVPAYVRRYPFVLANAEDDDRMIVCIDRAASSISEKADRPFFNGETPSEYTKEAFEFLKTFEQNRKMTEEVINVIKEYDLFEKKEVNYQPQNVEGKGQTAQKLADYFSVSEEKLKKLPKEKQSELMEKGYMGVIYAHLVSLTNWQPIINKAIRRASQKENNKTVN